MRTDKNYINLENIKLYYYDNTENELTLIRRTEIFLYMYKIDVKRKPLPVHCEEYLKLLENKNIIVNEPVECYLTNKQIEIVRPHTHFTIIGDLQELKEYGELGNAVTEECESQIKILSSEIIRYKMYDIFNVFIKVYVIHDDYTETQYCEDTMWINNTEEKYDGHARLGYMHLNTLNIKRMTPLHHKSIRPPMVSSCLLYTSRCV